MSDNQIALNRVRIAAKRGMLELDLMLEPYVENAYLQASELEKNQFHALLLCEDQDLFAWFIQSKKADDQYRDIVEKVLLEKKRSFHQ
ncbi:succinate dehydrogenase assembly factor 2 [Fangia hongkongensis]|uniref:FAD assembly factor SdhE n=1 Tax=Fangia hongkongensis TaxID=270495 RepID=UPI00037ABEE8|nr:succinate dehydrogenase assembly factor 2 [Fangia hongkongensis]MBK2125157.1 succinate dehydrogenase assembly factor 2 [Fangia hongkongensis]